MADFEMVVGNTDPPLRTNLIDANGQAANLNGAQDVRFIMRAIRGALGPKVNGAAIVDDEDTASVHYDWQPQDVDILGGFFGRWRVTFANGRFEDFPNDRWLTIAFHPDIAAVIADPVQAFPTLASMQALADDRSLDHDPTDLRALRALETASALFRSKARQTISYVEDHEVELRGNWTRELWLPERPVIDVSSITIIDGWLGPISVPMSYVTWSRRGLVELFWGSDWGGPRTTVKVVYSHGYDAIPDDIGGVVLSMAERRLAETIASPDSTGTMGLTTDELEIAERYRPVDA